MKLAVVTIVPALLIGLATGGRFRRLASARLRWWPAAVTGVALQVVPVAGNVGLWLLLASFAVLSAFVLVNARLPGFPLILVGLLLNFAVIAANQGMPVTGHALEASGQGDTLEELGEQGGAKHHLADDGSRLLILGDVIPLGSPVNRAISLGDIGTHLGVAWFIVAGMHGPPPFRARPKGETQDRSSEEPADERSA